VQLAGKVMESVFWDPKGILLTDYLQLQNTFGEAENSNSGKHPGMAKKKMLFSTTTMHVFIPVQLPTNNRIEVPTSCAPSDFQYFHKTEKIFSWKEISVE
jgi:hypothetical protein